MGPIAPWYGLVELDISLLGYYQQHTFHPIKIPVEDPSVFERHLRNRNHLYQDQLHLPLSLLKDKDVLELGCATGENALMLALQGVRVTLVDADPTVAPRVEALFERFGLTDRVRRKTFCTFEEYQDELVFPLVAAEGFLFILPNRDAMLRKVCGLIQPGGFGIVSFNDRYGSFFEALKKAVMWRAYQIEGITDIHSQSALNIAHQLFEASYEQLPHTREFFAWWKDTMVTPFLNWRHNWDYDEVLEILAEEGCSFYSSSPRVYEEPHLTWYKALQSPAAHWAAVRSSYAARKFDFLFGEPVGITEETEGLTQLSEAVAGILKELSKYFRSLDEPLPAIDFEPVVKLFAGAGIKHESLAEMVEFFHLLRTDSITELLDGYASLGQLSLRWGCLYHYLCFTKDAELPA